LSLVNIIAWGDNSYGQTDVPPGLTNAVAVAGGLYFSLALRADGTVAGWGDNSGGQLDIPTGLSNVVAIAGGDYFSMALKSDGTIVAWGDNSFGQTDVPGELSNVVAIAAGGETAYALTAAGSVVAWGDDYYGEASPPLGLTNVIAVAGGDYYGLALKGDGTATSWGGDFWDSLNLSPGLSNVVAITAGAGFSQALRADGTIVESIVQPGLFGHHYGYQVPAGLSNVVGIAQGADGALALTANGLVVAWGDDTYGETNVPAGLTGVTAIGGGAYHDLAVEWEGRPFLTTRQANEIESSGGTVELYVNATGGQPLSYQWQFNGTTLPGATNAVLTLTNVQPAQAGGYRLIVSNRFGTVTNSTATVDVVVETGLPTITLQPQNQTTLNFSGPNPNVLFSVTAVGSPPLIYQWQFDGTNLSGATNAALILSNPSFNLFGSYDVVVSNSFGSVTSVVVTLFQAGAIYATPYTFTTMAGRPPIGSADGVSGLAQFNGPAGVAMDKNGNSYIADRNNGTIRQLTPSGVVTTLAGSAGSFGSADGTNSEARFSGPSGVTSGLSGVAVGANGVLYVADSGNNSIRELAPVGTNWVVTTLACTNALLANPQGIAVDTNGNIYVADTGNAVIRKITPSGVVTNLTSTGTNSPFSTPTAIALDCVGNLYVADTGGDMIYGVASNGTVSAVAGSSGNSGSANGTNNTARFDKPYGVAVDANGILYVADSGNNAIRRLIQVGTNWVVSTLAGLHLNLYGNPASGYADGTGTNALFNNPDGIAVDSNGNLRVADAGNELIREVTSAGLVRTLAGTPGANNDGVGTAARFDDPTGIAMDSEGNIYVADTGNSTIRQVTSAGVVITLAGSPGNPGTNDGIGDTAQFNHPTGVAVDEAGNLYVADTGNYTIRMITTAGVVSTIAGAPGFYEVVDGTNSSARFGYPADVTVGPDGNLYVLDGGGPLPENTYIRIVARKGADWVVSTMGAFVGYQSQGLTASATTNIYVADTGDYFIVELTQVGTSWVEEAVAGLGYPYPPGYADGIGANSLFYFPARVAVDTNGDVYVTDDYINAIRKITPASEVTTLAGGGGRGSTDGAGYAARFYNPSGIAVDSVGNVYVADSGNNTIRKGAFTQYIQTNPVTYTPPPMNGQLQVMMSGLPTNIAGLVGQWRFPWEQGWNTNGQVVSNLAAGSYTIEFQNPPGYVAFPPSVTLPVTNGVTTMFTNQYYPAVGQGGPDYTAALTVNILPGQLTNTGWRLLGETSWRAPGSTLGNLLPGTYDLEFEQVSGYSEPPDQAVFVYANQTTVLEETYTEAASPPAGVSLPVPVPTNSIEDLADWPFGFNGQLQTDAGYGSGVAVETNVVLTAAHLVFDDETLSYVSSAYWYFQEEAGVFEPEPLEARGWYVLSGYASERIYDINSGGDVPNQSSAGSRNLDVAALYFEALAAGGGSGGCLWSDAVPNPWLMSSALKMLVGYPVDGAAFGQVVTNGLMYYTEPQPNSLSPASDPGEPQVYLANWFLGYPGDSGGPLYVQFDGYYYPAGVYLGAVPNGDTSVSAVRAIDSVVLNLITNAAVLGDLGTNYVGTNYGGGVVTFIPNLELGTNHPGYVQVPLGPPAAVAAGANWTLAGSSFPAVYNPSNTAEVLSNGASIVFAPLTNWYLPTNQSVSVVTNALTVVSNAVYIPIGWVVNTSQNPPGSGTTTGDNAYTNGQSVTVTAIPDTCYTFVNWSSNGVVVSNANPYTFPAGTNATLTANFLVNNYTISNSVFPAGAGSVSPPFSAACGSQITLTATNGACYQFTNWTVGGSAVSTSTNYVFTVSNNVSPIANFVAAQEVMAQASPANGGTVSGSGSYVADSSVTLTSTPASGWMFLGWSDGLPAQFSRRTIQLGTIACGVTNLVAKFQPGSALVQLSALHWTSGTFSVSLNAPTGIYRVDVSTNLPPTWRPLMTNVTTNKPALLADPTASNFVQRFYRAVWVP
jgi:sugar lactone lactonase YvrE